MAEEELQEFAVFRSADEPDIELEVFENPIDASFPRMPNVVSRRGHKLKIKVRVDGNRVIPPNATAVTFDAQVFTFNPTRIGHNMHVFRHRFNWGTLHITRQLEEHVPPYEFEIVVTRQGGDDHLGEGPYEAAVKVTASGEGLSSERQDEKRNEEGFDVAPYATIAFVSM